MIARKHLCDWSNCDSEEVVVTINYRGQERPTFCCEEHAANWLNLMGRRHKPSAPQERQP